MGHSTTSNSLLFREIIAVDGKGITYSGQISMKRVLTIGAGPQADLRLNGKSILPIHADLLMTETNEVLIVNLGKSASLLLNDTPVATFVPRQWRSGDVVKVDGYTLCFAEDIAGSSRGSKKLNAQRRVNAINGSEPVDRSHSTTAAILTDAQAGYDTKTDSAAQGAMVLTAPKPMQLAELTDPYSTDGILPAHSIDKTELTTWRPTPPELSLKRTGRDIRSDADLEAVGATEGDYHPERHVGSLLKTVRSASLPANQTVDPVVVSGKTLRKVWNYQGRLSALLSINPVNVVLGERIRVLLSVRNEYSHTVNLQLIVAGLPSDWLILSAPTLTLAPGEIRAVDLVLQTQPTLPATSLEAVLYLNDLAVSQIMISLPLKLVFKNAPDLVGWLDPAHLSDSRPTYLHLQNHTQEAAQIFINGQCAPGSGVFVIITHPWIELPPGQMIRIPIQFDVRQRPVLKSRSYFFWVSATQGTRAPLDYAGTIRVRPHLPRLA
ncbi:MAG: FHA domain-containing protein [Chloroflexota bacterium]